MTKKCFKCEIEKDISLFYKHKGMADGHIGKCKECTKNDVKKRYYNPDSLEKIIEYEKLRYKNPERKKKLLEYQRKRRLKFPEKNMSRQKIAKLLASGKINKERCIKCGNINTEAHHKDYSKPLDIIWLCRKHHKEIHNCNYWGK